MGDMAKCTVCGKLRHVRMLVGDVCRYCNNHIKKVSRTFEDQLMEDGMVLDAIGRICDGEEVTDFEMSYSIVRKVYDAVNQQKE